jgi:DNA sulfur modification protein DndD
MKILRVELENFLCYYGRQSADLSPSPGKPVTIIHGNNGFGKTSLSHAIDYGLYGKQARHGLDAQSVFNWTAKKEGKTVCAVRITFEESGTVYDLARWYERPDGTKENFGGERFSCTPKGAQAISDEEYQRLISKVFPYEVSPLFFFDGEELRSIEKLVEDERAKAAIELRDRLEMVLGVPALQRARTVANSAQDRMDATYQALLQDSANNKQLETDLRASIALITQLDDQLKKHRAEKEENERQLARVRVDLSSFDAAAEIVRKQLVTSADLLAVEGRLSTAFGRRCEATTPLYIELARSQLQEAVEDFSTREKAAKGGQSQALKLSGQQDLLNEILRDKKCVCRTPIDEGRRVYVESRATSVAESLAKTDCASKQPVPWGWLGEQVETKLAGDYWSEYNSAEAAVGQLLVDKTELEGRLASYAKALQNDEQGRIRQLADEQAGFVRAIAQLEGEIVRFEKELEEAKVAKKGLDQKILGAAATTNRVRVEERRVAVAKEAAESLEAAIEELRQIKRHDVQEAASTAFLAMRWKEDFAGLRIQKGYGLTIHLASGEDVPVRSAGESQIVALALLAGLNHCAEIRAPVIMDTLFGRLDREHRTRVLQYLAKIGEQVVLLVTSGELDEPDLAPIRGQIAHDLNIRYVGYGRSELNGGN